MNEVLRDREMLNKARETLIMRECVRELLPRTKLIMKGFLETHRKNAIISIGDIPYYRVFKKSDYFIWTLKKYGAKCAVELAVFMALCVQQ